MRTQALLRLLPKGSKKYKIIRFAKRIIFNFSSLISRSHIAHFSLLIFHLATNVALLAQTTALPQHHFKKTVPAGNYSGITWLGDNRYAVVNDKAAAAGFHLMTIDIDSITGEITSVRADTFITKGYPARDEEGICYMPSERTIFLSSEADHQILEYRMDGQRTGRQLAVPEVFKTAASNASLEALTYSADTHRFWTTSENTLTADGQCPDIHHKISNRLRLQSFGDHLQPLEQYWYETDTSVVKRQKGKSNLGVSALAVLPDSSLIVLEREIYQRNKIMGFVQVKLYRVYPTHHHPGDLLPKELLTSFRTRINLTARNIANYEGLCLGPRLADGSQVLLLVADSQNQYRHILRDWFKTIKIEKVKR